MKKPIVLLLAVPLALALLFLCAGSLFPLRLDCRTLQHLTRFEGLDQQLSGARQIIYLSRDNGGASGQMATFTLRHIAFPDAGRIWLILAENHAGEYWGEWLAVDDKGEYFAPGRPPPALVSVPKPTSLGILLSRVVCDSREVLLEFQKRVPELAGVGNVIFLDDLHGRGGFVFSLPRQEFSFVRILRLSLLLGAVLSYAMAMANMITASGESTTQAGNYAFGGAAGLIVGISIQIWLASICWQAWPFLLAAQWGTGLFLLRNAPPLTVPRANSSSLCVAAALGISLAVFVVRLDFDGDVMTHWLPMARSFYHLGHHDPATLLAQGSSHAATYPPGFGIFLAMAMWTVDMDTLRSFLPGNDTSLAILYYRLAIWILNVAFLVLLAGHLIRQSPVRSYLWLAGLAMVAGIFPTLRGTHVGAETLLFPLLGSALVLLVAAPERSYQNDRKKSETPFDPFLLLVSVAIAGVALLVKLESALLVAGIFLPWFLFLLARNPAMRSLRVIAIVALVGVAAIVPTVLWKSGMHIDNGFFTSPSIGAVWTGRAEWVTLLIAALTFLLKLPLWIPLLLLLPAGSILGNRTKFRWSNLLLPAATALLFFAFVSIYLFSTWPTKTLHIEQSFDRLLYVPALSCILYFLESHREKAALQ